MSRRNARLFALVLASVAVATHAASCHCGNPTASSTSRGEGASPSPRNGEGAGGEVATHASRLTTTASSDADFLTANRGYGVVEDTSVSAGIIRRTLGLPNFGLANANPTVEGWQSTTALTIARHGHGTVVVNGRIYVIGGDTAVNVFTDDVSIASMKADGSISAWTTTQKLPKPIWAPAAVAHNGTIYVIGGNGSGALRDVYYTKPNTDGTIAGWQTTSLLMKGRESPAAVIMDL